MLQYNCFEDLYVASELVRNCEGGIIGVGLRESKGWGLGSF